MEIMNERETSSTSLLWFSWWISCPAQTVCTLALLISLLGPATVYPPFLVPLDHFIANLTDHSTEKCTAELA